MSVLPLALGIEVNIRELLDRRNLITRFVKKKPKITLTQ
jgi:hypothetical protein